MITCNCQEPHNTLCQQRDHVLSNCKLICTHGRREDTHESRAATEVAYHRFSGGHLKGCWREDRCVIRQAKRIERAIEGRGIKGLVHGNRGSAFQQPAQGVLGRKGYSAEVDVNRMDEMDRA